MDFQGNNTLLGGSGNDELLVSGGSNVLDGGAGNDQINGGAGNDEYRFAPGFGQDYLYAGGGSDKVVFGSGIDPAGMAITRSWNDLSLTTGGGTDRLKIMGYFAVHGAGDRRVVPLRRRHDMGCRRDRCHRRGCR